MKFKRWLIALLGVFAMALTGVGLSTFTYAKDSFGFVTNLEPVCYIKETGVRYPSVESAIRAASTNTAERNSKDLQDTIYVIPGAHPTMYKSATLLAKDQLILPYQDETYEDTGRTATLSTFADVNPGNERDPKLLVSRLTLAPGVSLTISKGADLFIGGMLGTGPQSPTGHVAGSYTEILMSANSRIENYGIIKNYGYIKTTGNDNGAYVREHSGAEIYLPMVIYDYRGGTYTNEANSKNVMPFTQFDIPTIQVFHRVDFEARLKGFVTMQASSTVFSSEPIVIGYGNDTCLFCLSSGYLSMHYRPKNTKYYTKDTGDQIKSMDSVNKTEVRISGDIALKSLQVSIKVIISVTVDTAKMDCSFCHKFDIHIDSGKTILGKPLKFLPGSMVYVHEGAILEVKNRVSFYKSYYPNNAYVPAYSTKIEGASSTLKVDGTAHLNSAFGGTILANAEKGRIITGKDFKATNTTMEAINLTSNNALSHTLDTENHDEPALIFRVQKEADATDTGFTYVNFDEVSPAASSTYCSTSLGQGAGYGWCLLGDLRYGVRFVLNDAELPGTVTNPNTGLTSFTLASENTVLTPLVCSDARYKCTGFYYDAECTVPLLSNDGGKTYEFSPTTAVDHVGNYNHVKIYATWLRSEVGFYTVMKSYLTKEGNEAKTTTEKYDGTVGEDYDLRGPTEPFFIYSASGATATITDYLFDSYTVQVNDGTPITVGTDGNSAEGEVKNWVLDSSKFVNGTVVTIKAKQPKTPTNLTMSVSLSRKKLDRDTYNANDNKATVTISNGSSSRFAFDYDWSGTESFPVTQVTGSPNQATYKFTGNVSRWDMSTTDGPVACKITVMVDGETQNPAVQSSSSVSYQYYGW
ncbi:MAG: hypothetical protein SOV58_06620 [Candidatus Enteromonas sp.]|nr:hypothetical protein [Candidatus Enteromonas sp.]